MHPNQSHPEMPFQTRNAYKKNKGLISVDNEAVFAALSSKFGYLSSQLKEENKKGQFLSWHMNYESDGDKDQTNTRQFNLEFRNKTNIIVDIQVSMDNKGHVKIEGGTNTPDIVEEVTADSIQGLKNTPAFKKYITATQIFARDGYYRLKSIISISQLTAANVSDYLDNIVEQMGLFLQLLLRRINLNPDLL